MKISVALCTYNGEKYIEEQIESIINQTKKVDEIIICDDCSKDNTIKLINKYLKKINIKVLQNKNNMGVVKNFIKAFNACSGDIVFLCDQDDIWKKNKVQVIVDLFKKNKQINMIGTDALLIDGNGNSLNAKLWDTIGYKWSKNNLNENYIVQLKKAFLTGATAAARKKFIDDFMIESKYVIHDYWLSECASMTDSLLMHNECLTKYRQHQNNVVGVKKRNKFTFLIGRIFKVNYYYNLYKKNYNQYLELYNFLKQKNSNLLKHKKYFDDCLYFWKTRSNLVSYKLKGLFNLHKELRRENLYFKKSKFKQFMVLILDLHYYFILKLKRNTNEK